MSQEDTDPLSPDHTGNQEVTSQGGGAEQVQKEEGERKGPANKSTDQGTESQNGGPGVCLAGRCLRVCSTRRGAAHRCYPDRERQAEEPRGPGPFYFFGGANGAELVSKYCESRGWKRVYDKNREDVKLKWCETKSPANYYNFREGEQLLYQIPNNKLLTSKIGLLCSLRQYDRVNSKVNHGRGLRRLKMEEFFPTSFRMDVRGERETFFAQQKGVHDKENPMWICKPTGLNQGRGIFLLQTQEDVAALKVKLQDVEDSQARRKVYVRPPQARIVQWYIQKPLLLKGRKFDVRSYLLIACTAPYMVFFRHGYVRLTCDLYDPSTSNLSAHLTNQYMQKKNPLYSLLKEDTVWSMESFNTYVNDQFRVAKGVPRDWVMGPFAKRMQQIMTQCFFAVKSKLDCKLGFFDLIGCDFMIDEDFKVWLLEMNCNPALHTNCEVLKEVVPSTVIEALDITLEIFSKCHCRQPILPLASQRDFVLLYHGVYPPAPPCARSRTRGTRSDSASHRKTTERTHKREPAMWIWGRSGRKGRIVSTVSSDISVRVNVLGTAGTEGSSNSAHPAPISTSPLHQSPPKKEDLSKTPSNSNTIRMVTPKQHIGTNTAETLKHSPLRPNGRTTASCHCQRWR